MEGRRERLDRTPIRRISLHVTEMWAMFPRLPIGFCRAKRRTEACQEALAQMKVYAHAKTLVLRKVLPRGGKLS